MKRLALLTLVLAGCATAKPAAAPPPLAVPVDSHKAEVTTQTLTEATVTVTATATAPEPGITATAAHWELVFDGNVIAHGDQALNVPIATDAPTSLSLVGQGAVAHDAQGVAALSAHTGGYSIALRGTIDFQGPNGSTGQSPFAKATYLREPRMPKVVMVEVGASHYDDGHVNLTFNIGLDNPNPFPVDVAGFTYAIDVNDQPVAKASTGGAVEVPPSAKKVLEETVELTPDKFKGLEDIYKQNAMKYRMRGVLDTGLAKFDVDIGAPIHFTR